MSNAPAGKGGMWRGKGFSGIFDLPFAVPAFVVLMIVLVILPIAWNFYASGDVHHLNPISAMIGFK